MARTEEKPMGGNVEIIRGFDLHVHLRDGEMMGEVLPHTAAAFAGALVMPNLRPDPVRTVAELRAYHRRIRESAVRAGFSRFRALMTFQLLPDTTPEQVAALAEEGATAGKLYPAGVTTNSDNGVADVEVLSDVLAAMEREGLVLCVHGEHPGEPDHARREEAFLPSLDWIVRNFPNLRVVLEHVSSRSAVERVAAMPETVAATVTVHHALLTWADVDVRDGTVRQPHNLCMPVAKSDDDRRAVLAAMLSGNPKFFFGSDSAPHPVAQKEDPTRRWPSNPPSFGVYSADVALPLLTELFERHAGRDWPERLEGFAATHGAAFYGVALDDTVRIEKRPWRVPERYGLVRSFWHGRELAWRVADR